MACFIVPVTEALVTTAITKAAKAHEQAPANKAEAQENHVPFSRKLKWLTSMLCGGSALLAFEHVWHGEVVPVFPFLTAASNPADASAMLHEMATAGVCMALLVTAVWGIMVLVTNAMEKKARAAQTQA